MAYRDVILADGPSNYWRLNEPSGTTAVDLVGAKNGAISGGVTLAQPGALADGDKAMTFDGTTGKIVTAVNGTIPAIFTLEQWIRASSAGSERPTFAVGVGAANVDSYFFKLYSAGNPGCQINHSDNGVSDGPVSMGGSICDGRWHHVVWVFPGGLTLQLYIDGVKVSLNAQLRTAIVGTTRPMELGWASAWPQYFNGSLDEVAIYPVALTAAQILAHYQARALPFLPGTYPYSVVQDGASNFWRLNEPSGTTAVDLVGGANGTISGGVTLNQPGALSDGDKAMAFNGTASTQILTTLPVGIVPPVTVECWCKAPVLSTNFLLSNRSGNSGNHLLILQNAGLWTATLHYAGTTSPDQSVNTTPRADGLWHHLVLVVTPTTGTLYVDGVVQPGALTFPAAWTGVTYPWSIGGEQGATSWNGSLDEVAIYPVALTAAQIAAHYASAFALSVPSGGADDDDEDDDDEARFRLQEFYGSIAGSVHVAASDSGLIPLVPARSKHTLFVQRLAPVVTTGGPASWTVQDGALPPVPLLIAPASAVAVLPVRDFGANGVPCTEGAPLLLNLSAAGAAGWLTWEGYRKLTGVETLPSATSPHYRDLVIADGASNYWRLNEPSGLTAVDQIGGANGTISGGVTLNQPGALADGDTAMTFNGTTGKIVTAANVALLTPFTVEVWFKVSSVAANVPLISTRLGYPTRDIVQLKLQVSNGFPTIVLDYANATSPEQIFPVVINGADGQWHQFVAVVTALNVDLYVDGTFRTPSHPLPATFTGASFPVTLSNDQFDGFGAGSLDDVAIYPVALTAAQIAAHYAARANL